MNSKNDPDREQSTSDPCPACGLNRVIVGKAHNCRPRPKTLGQIAAEVFNSGFPQLPQKVDKSRHIVVDKTLSKVDNIATELTKPNKGGRPSTTGKPWLVEGISRQAWYKRRKRSKV